MNKDHFKEHYGRIQQFFEDGTIEEFIKAVVLLYPEKEYIEETFNIFYVQYPLNTNLKNLKLKIVIKRDEVAEMIHFKTDPNMMEAIVTAEADDKRWIMGWICNLNNPQNHIIYDIERRLKEVISQIEIMLRTEDNLKNVSDFKLNL